MELEMRLAIVIIFGLLSPLTSFAHTGGLGPSYGSREYCQKIILQEGPKVVDFLRDDEFAIGFQEDGQMYIIADGMILASRKNTINADPVLIDMNDPKLSERYNSSALSIKKVTSETRVPNGIVFRLRRTPEVVSDFSSRFVAVRDMIMNKRDERYPHDQQDLLRMTDALGCLDSALYCSMEMEFVFDRSSARRVYQHLLKQSSPDDSLLIVGDVSNNALIQKILTNPSVPYGVRDGLKTVAIGAVGLGAAYLVVVHVAAPVLKGIFCLLSAGFYCSPF